GQGIPELRERTRQMAEDAQNKLQAIASKDIVGELLDLELGKSGISMMNVTQDMVMAKTGIARGHFMFAQANTLALAVIDAPAALTGVANVKYKVPIYAGASLIARAEVIRIEDKKYFIWVKIRNNNEEVFRAKFIVVSLPNERIV
ncbi:MAG: transcription factor FapR, partial [Acholeplasmataceae bacterium]|nr:transcription factor FapR [Acholeplasmataceae bacterium]